ncbi:MAG: hypothetical protein RR502_04765, partial [Oscillospiraceae bacterium]
TVYIDNVPTLVDMRVRLIQQEKNGPEENVLYYFSPETITLTKRDGDTPAAERQAFRGEASPSLDITLPQEQSGVNAEDMQNGANDVPVAPNGPAADGLGAMDARFPYQQKQSKVGINTFTGVYADVLDQMETDGGNVSSLFCKTRKPLTFSGLRVFIFWNSLSSSTLEHVFFFRQKDFLHLP